MRQDRPKRTLSPFAFVADALGELLELVRGDFLLLLFDNVLATPVIEVPGDFRGGFPFSMSVDMLLQKSTEGEDH